MGSSRGIALLVTMMALLVLVGLTGALIPLTSSEVDISAHHGRAVRTRYAAESAFEWAVQELQPLAAWDAVLDGTRRSALWAGSTTHRLADGSTLDLAQITAELRRDGADAGSRNLSWRLYAHGALSAILPGEPSLGLLRVAVWLADDPAEGDGDPFRDSNRVVLLHAVAAGPALARQAVQATLRRPAPGLPIRVVSWAAVR